MPGSLTPEQRRAYRDRCIAEGRCANCARPLPPDNGKALTCAACRATKTRGSARRYADQREQNPPDFARDARNSFRYGKTRLKNPRRITLVLDFEVVELLDLCRKNWVTSSDYEPYQVSEFVRRILSLLQTGDHPRIPCFYDLRRDESGGLKLCFMCDEDNFAVLERQRERTGCTLPAAVRDCLRYAIKNILFRMPDAEARRFLWPRKTQELTPLELPDWEDKTKADEKDIGMDMTGIR